MWGRVESESRKRQKGIEGCPSRDTRNTRQKEKQAKNLGKVRGREDLAGGNASGASRRDHELGNQKGEIGFRWGKERREELYKVDGGESEESRKSWYRWLGGIYIV